MNRGDVKLMIDRLNSVTLSVDAEDEQTIDSAIYMLGELANEIAKLQANLDRHMEVIVKGAAVNEMMAAELGEKNDQIVQLRQELARYKEREKTMGWNQT